MRVKICGITSVVDAEAAVSAGADAIGLVFYPQSPRNVDIDSARAIARAVGPFVTVVGLFVDADSARIHEVLHSVPLNLLQFHGEELPTFCEQFDRPYIKALRMKPDVDVQAFIQRYSRANGILLDAYHPAMPGGTGETFDWQRVPTSSAMPIVLAGGLTPDNVKTAVSVTQPYGVDVSGGVELTPGKKDREKVAAFIRCAKNGEFR